ncbi:MAG TPA: hypothetical protein VKB96_18400 [Gammaproteobacteria bacterium]|nr:hypothetical protein [Gammaproteobacteria bacterium]
MAFNYSLTVSGSVARRTQFKASTGRAQQPEIDRGLIDRAEKLGGQIESIESDWQSRVILDLPGDIGG